MLMYLEHLQNWLIYGLGLWIYLILALFWLSETGQIWGFRAYPGECIGGNGLKFCMLMYLAHFQNWLIYGLGLWIYLILALFWLSEMGQIWGFRAYPGECIGGNGLKFCMLMYLDHLQNWLVLGHGLLSFVILALFWLSETGQIWGFRAFPEECMKGMAWNMVCCCILTTFRTV